jgi:predicted phosphoribosyltransferase
MFSDRAEAGRKLAVALSGFAGRVDVLVLGLPRGGVVVAFEVARELDVDMDLFLVRKLGVPGNPELAMGAIASGGMRTLNEDVVQAYRIRQESIEQVTSKEKKELQRREKLYRGDRPFPDMEGHTILLIDDGLATGASMRAAVRALESRDPKKIVVAVPTGPAEVCDSFRSEGVETFCLETPEPFFGVGGSYRNFGQVTDQEVQKTMEENYNLEKKREHGL